MGVSISILNDAETVQVGNGSAAQDSVAPNLVHHHAQQRNVLQEQAPPLILSPPPTQLPYGAVSTRHWTERVAGAAHTMKTSTKAGHPAILPVPATAVTNPAAKRWAMAVGGGGGSNCNGGGSSKANNNGGVTGACVVVDC